MPPPITPLHTTQPYSPSVRSNSVHSDSSRSFDFTDFQYPRQPSFARGLIHSVRNLVHQVRTDVRHAASSGPERHDAARTLGRRFRDFEARAANTADRLSQFLLHERFKEAINRHDVGAAQQGLNQGVSLRYSSSLGDETWGHRIARVNPYSAQSQHIMRFVLNAQDNQGNQVNLGQGDHKLRTPAHFAATSNNAPFFEHLIAIARQDPHRDLGVDTVDYKGRTCAQLTNHPRVLAQINEIRNIQADARARRDQQSYYPPEPNQPRFIEEPRPPENFRSSLLLDVNPHAGPGSAANTGGTRPALEEGPLYATVPSQQFRPGQS